MNLIELRNKYESARQSCISKVYEMKMQILQLEQLVAEEEHERELYEETMLILDNLVVRLRKEDPGKYTEPLRYYHVGLGLTK